MQTQPMPTKPVQIKVEHYPNQDELQHLSLESWPLWRKEVSTFPAVYLEEEVCYFLEGEVEIIPDAGEPVRAGVGDLITLPAGLSCTWTVIQDVKKYYCAPIVVHFQVSQNDLDNLGAMNWPSWTQSASEFLQQYDAKKTFYFVEGEVLLTPNLGEPVQVQAGDLVTFHAGLACAWAVKSNVKAFYCYPEQYV